MFWIYLMGAGERKEWGWSADGCLMMQLSVLYLIASLFFLNQLFINSVGSLGWVRGKLCWFQVSLLSQWWTGLGQWGKSRIGLKDGPLKGSPLGCLGLYSVFNNSWIRWWDGCGCSCLLATSELAISKLGIRLGLAEPFIRHGWFMVVLS